MALCCSDSDFIELVAGAEITRAAYGYFWRVCRNVVGLKYKTL